MPSTRHGWLDTRAGEVRMSSEALSRKALRKLIDDGLESLGDVTLGATVVAGDPSLLLGPLGAGGWWGGAVRPGTWRALGRPWRRDPDQLDEVVLVHDDALASFYDLYDAAAEAATLALPTGKLAVLDGALRTDAAVLKGIAQADAFPWLLERGIALGAILGFPAQIAAPRSVEGLLVSFGLGPTPDARVAGQAHSVGDGADDE